MNSDQHIDQEVEKTLQSLDNITRQQPDDYFYTRLMVRLHSTRRHKAAHQLRLSFSIAFAALVVAVNLSALLYFKPFAVQSEASTSRDELYREYDLDTFNFYNYEINDEQ